MKKLLILFFLLISFKCYADEPEITDPGVISLKNQAIYTFDSNHNYNFSSSDMDNNAMGLYSISAGTGCDVTDAFELGICQHGNRIITIKNLIHDDNSKIEDMKIRVTLPKWYKYKIKKISKN